MAKKIIGLFKKKKPPKVTEVGPAPEKKGPIITPLGASNAPANLPDVIRRQLISRSRGGLGGSGGVLGG